MLHVTNSIIKPQTDMSIRICLLLHVNNSFLFQEEEGWWEGSLNGKIGMFPSNFVEVIDVLEQRMFVCFCISLFHMITCHYESIFTISHLSKFFLFHFLSILGQCLNSFLSIGILGQCLNSYLSIGRLQAGGMCKLRILFLVS